MTSWLKLRIAWETVKGKWKLTALLTFIFMGFSAMYTGVYPTFEDMLGEFTEMPLEFIRGFESMGTFSGFLNVELYQIFWILILPTLIAYIAGSLISEEIESKTIDMLMANPVSRSRIVLEKFIGLIPLILTVNFATMGTVYGMASVIGEELIFKHLFLTHLWTIPYFLSVAGLSLLISTIIDKKMKASIIGMAIIVGMYLFESISQLVPDYEKIGIISLVNYFDPSELLVKGNTDIAIPFIILTILTIVFVSLAMMYFERRDIT